MSNRLVWRLLLAGVVAGAAWFLRGWGTERANPPLVMDLPAPPAVSPAGHSDIGFRDAGHLRTHFEKHGREFGAIDQAEYLGLAQALRDQPAGGPILEATRADGVITRFDRRSGAFLAFDRDRTIRTFFKPNDGERYYQRQLAREPSQP